MRTILNKTDDFEQAGVRYRSFDAARQAWLIMLSFSYVCALWQIPGKALHCLWLGTSITIRILASTRRTHSETSCHHCTLNAFLGLLMTWTSAAYCPRAADQAADAYMQYSHSHWHVERDSGST